MLVTLTRALQASVAVPPASVRVPSQMPFILASLAAVSYIIDILIDSEIRKTQIKKRRK